METYYQSIGSGLSISPLQGPTEFDMDKFTARQLQRVQEEQDYNRRITAPLEKELQAEEKKEKEESMKKDNEDIYYLLT